MKINREVMNNKWMLCVTITMSLKEQMNSECEQNCELEETDCKGVGSFIIITYLKNRDTLSNTQYLKRIEPLHLLFDIFIVESCKICLFKQQRARDRTERTLKMKERTSSG